MGNIKIHASLANGDLMSIVENKTSGEIAFAFTGEDTGAPPISVTIEVFTDSGHKVKIYIPNSSANANVTIDGKII